MDFESLKINGILKLVSSFELNAKSESITLAEICLLFLDDPNRDIYMQLTMKKFQDHQMYFCIVHSLS